MYVQHYTAIYKVNSIYSQLSSRSVQVLIKMQNTRKNGKLSADESTIIPLALFCMAVLFENVIALRVTFTATVHNSNVEKLARLHKLYIKQLEKLYRRNFCISEQQTIGKSN